MSIKYPLFVQIRLPGFHWSKEVKLYEKDQTKKWIELFDDFNLSLRVKVNVWGLGQGTRSFYFLTSCCIINESKVDLHFFSVSKRKTEYNSLPGQ